MAEELTPEKIRETIAESSGWFIGLGFILVLLGIAAIALPGAATLAVEQFIGWILVFGGIAQVIHSFATGNWSGVLLGILLGCLYLVAGGLLVFYPMEGALTLTLILAAFLIAEGIFKIMMGMRAQGVKGAGWLVFSGAMAILLGGLIWFKWPSDADWVIGLLVGIDVIFAGWTLVALGFGARSGPSAGAASA